MEEYKKKKPICNPKITFYLQIILIPILTIQILVNSTKIKIILEALELIHTLNDYKKSL